MSHSHNRKAYDYYLLKMLVMLFYYLRCCRLVAVQYSAIYTLACIYYIHIVLLLFIIKPFSFLKHDLSLLSLTYCLLACLLACLYIISHHLLIWFLVLLAYIWHSPLSYTTFLRQHET